MAGSYRKSSRRPPVLRLITKSGVDQDPGRAIRSLIFFVLFYLYLWLYVDLQLIYHSAGTKFGYTSWHPSGRMAAYSVNRVIQFFHSAEREVRDVLDLNSLLAYYLVDTGTVKTTPALAKKDRLETYPTWSPDGRYLYFCSAPLSWSRYDIVPPLYAEIKYDLVRISYDLDRDK